MLYIVDDPGGVPGSRKITVANFMGAPTAGAVFFAGTGGIPASDATNFFFDNATDTLFLGDNTVVPAFDGTLIVTQNGTNESILQLFNAAQACQVFIDNNGRSHFGTGAASIYNPLNPFSTIFTFETITDDLVTRAVSGFIFADYAAEFNSTVFGGEFAASYLGSVDLVDTHFIGAVAFASTNAKDVSDVTGVVSEIFVTTSGADVARLNGYEVELLVDAGCTVTNLIGTLYGSALGMGFWSVDAAAVTNSYMIYIAADTSVGTADNYGIYNESDALNYFEGFTGFGIDTPTQQVHITGNLLTVGRVLESQGADVSSTNEMTLGTDGNSFEITANTDIKSIVTADWTNGSIITLLFTSNPLVKHNTSGGGSSDVILLAGSVDFQASAGDTLTLIRSEIGGTQAWREIARAAI